VEIIDDWQQPQECWDYWVEHTTKPGDLVADPFACTGTIGVACKKAGLRKYIGTEIRKCFALAGQGRINEAQPRKAELKVVSA
jgi:DNA modification methylase